MVEPRFDVFVSFAPIDRSWVEGYLLDALHQARLTTCSELSLSLGAPRIVELERAIRQSARALLVCTPEYFEDRDAEFVDLLAQSHGLQSGTWRVIPLLLRPVTLPPRLAMLTTLDATNPDDWPSALARLFAELQVAVPSDPPRPDCPYPGMRSFAEEESASFFGREVEIFEILDRLRTHPFLALIGASGSGKSSLISAGVLPALRSRPERWMIQTVRPRESSAEALARTAGDLADRADVDRLLLVIDHFEELFTHPRPEIVAFEKALGRVPTSGKCHVLIAVRADFYRDLMTLALWREIQAHRLELLPLDADAMRQAIVKPAQQLHVFVETALADRLVRDAAHEPGSMALVQETLILLWDRLRRRLLTLSAYESLGRGGQTGLQVAIARRADQTLGELTDRQQQIAWRIFLRLVHFGEGRADSGRRQSVQSLKSADDEPHDFSATLQSLVRGRLLTVGARESAGDAHAQLGHEMLIHCWPRLQEWLAAHRQAEQVRRRLEEKAAEWVRLGRGTGGHLDEVELWEASRWLETPDAAELGCGDDLLQLVDSSRAAQEKAKEREELARQRELEQARALADEQNQRAEAEQKRREEQTRRVRTLAASLVAVALLLSIAVVTAWLAWRRKVEADHARRRSIVRSLIAQSSHFEIHREDERAALLARQAYLFNQRMKLHELGPIDNAIRGVLQMPAFVSILQERAGPIRSVIWTSDGQTLTAVGQNGIAAQWNRSGGVKRRINLTGYDPAMSDADVVFFRMILSSSGNRVAVSAPFAEKIELWDLRNPSAAPVIVQTANVHAASIAFSRDEKYLAAGTNRGQILIWPVAAPASAPRQLAAHSHSVTALAFSPDVKSLASSSHDGTIKLSKLATGASEILLRDQDRELTMARTQLVFRPDGAMLAMASGNGTIHIWDLARGADRDALVLGPYDEGIASAAFSSDSSRFAAGSDEGTVRLWDLSAIEQTPLTVQSHQHRIFSLSFHPNGQLLAAGNERGNVYVWQLVPGLRSRVASIEGTVDNETRVAFSPDGKRLISASIDGHLRFWSRDLREEGDLNYPIRAEGFTLQDSLMSFAVSPTEPIVATGSGSELVSGYVTIWDTRVNKPSSRGLGPEGPVFSVAFSPDGKLLAAGDEQGTIFVWNVQSHELLTKIHALDGIVWTVRFSPDGRLLVGAGNDGILRGWSVDDLAAAPRLIGNHTDAVLALAFSPDGRTLASAGLDSNIRLWDFDAPGAVPRVLKGHEGYIQALAFHPSGRSLASASSDGSVRLWDLMHPEDVITLRGHSKGVYSVAFSPDGAEVVSGGDDGTIRVWNPRTDVLADTICTQVWRNLTRDEWRHFVGEDIPYERTCPNLPVAPVAP